MEAEYPHRSEALIYFFRDVANLPIVTGKSQYLPLTRRIARARLLDRLAMVDHGQSFQRIQSALSKALHTFNQECESRELPRLSIADFADDIEPFLNDGNLRVPPTLSAYSASAENRDPDDTWVKAAWRCFYLTSLLPASARGNPDGIPSLEEVAAHFCNIEEEGESAKQELAEGTLRFVIRIARLYLGRGLSYLDLVQEGFFGLHRAIDTFDERLGAHFQSHAASWIRQRMTRAISDQARLIRIPVHQLEEVSQMHQKRTEFIEKKGRIPTDDEMFITMGWLTSMDVETIRRMALRNRALHLKAEIKTEYNKLIEYATQKPGEVSAKIRDRATMLVRKQQEFIDQYDRAPQVVELYHHLGWLSGAEFRLLQTLENPMSVDDKQWRALNTEFRKARKNMRHYRMVMAVHHSLESTEIHFENDDEMLLPEDLLVSKDLVEAQGFNSALADQIQQVLMRLDDREREIIKLRFGLSDGQERTLEEIGQLKGVTRERIRQIEAKALRKLKHPARYLPLEGYLEDTTDRVTYESEWLAGVLNNALREQEQPFEPTDTQTRQELDQIEKLMQKYIMGGRRSRIGSPRPGQRAQSFKRILEEAGTPLHHTQLHERSLVQLPPSLHFSPKTTYATLFQNDLFRSFGNGIFGLSDWKSTANGHDGKQVFIHCPNPLLPQNPNARSFFESIMVGRDLLSKRGTIDAQAFYTEMLAWARQPMGNIQGIQEAFNAWYAAGLVDWVDYAQNAHTSLALTIPADARLNDIRAHCLNHLCQRILKTPELLLALERIALPTTAALQRAIFGSEHAGFDVPTRLSILAAFEAVSFVGNVWRLTGVGRTMLEANPPEELPDFGELEAAPEEDTAELEWEDEFGLLDL